LKVKVDKPRVQMQAKAGGISGLAKKEDSALACSDIYDKASTVHHPQTFIESGSQPASYLIQKATVKEVAMDIYFNNQLKDVKSPFRDETTTRDDELYNEEFTNKKLLKQIQDMRAFLNFARKVGKGTKIYDMTKIILRLH
jgi:hypothetical protein